MAASSRRSRSAAPRRSSASAARRNRRAPASAPASRADGADQAASRTLITDTNATGERLRGNLDRIAERLTGSGEALLGAFDAAARERGEKLHRHFQALAQRMLEDAGRLADRLTSATAELGQGWRDTAAEADRLRANLATEALGRLGEPTAGASGELRAVVGDVEARLAALADASGRFIGRVELMLADSARHTTALTEAARLGEGQIQAAGQLFAEQATRLAAAASGAASAERQMQDNLERLDRALTETAAGGAERIGGLEDRVRNLAGAARGGGRRSRAPGDRAHHRFPRRGRGSRRDRAQGGVPDRRGPRRGQGAARRARHARRSDHAARRYGAQQPDESGRNPQHRHRRGAHRHRGAMHEQLREQAHALAASADCVAERLAEIGAEVDGRAERLVAATDYATRRAGEIASGFGERRSCCAKPSIASPARSPASPPPSPSRASSW